MVQANQIFPHGKLLTHLSKKVNNMAADVLVKQGSGASTAFPESSVPQEFDLLQILQ